MTTNDKISTTKDMIKSVTRDAVFYASLENTNSELWHRVRSINDSSSWVGLKSVTKDLIHDTIQLELDKI